MHTVICVWVRMYLHMQNKNEKNTVLGNAYCCLSLGMDVLTC